MNEAVGQKYFIEADSSKASKHKMRVCGDTFSTMKLEGGSRCISILADGLGSGIKASVLSTICSSMFMQWGRNDFDIEKSAKLIMDCLPVCKVRKIAYSTFSIVDVSLFGVSKIVEFDNPPVVVVRDGKILDLEKEEIPIALSNGHESKIYYSQFQLEKEDRIVLMSDGVAQSGLGTKFPVGWPKNEYQKYILNLIKEDSRISAQSLSKALVARSKSNDDYRPKDDITAGVIYVREPRKTIVVTGPPFNKKSDKEMASMVNKFSGKKIICGGTTASILSRELGLELTLNDEIRSTEFPPTSTMPGFDLVTEGGYMLAKTLEHMEFPDDNSKTPLYESLTASDEITFLVGTRINEAHYGPSISYDLEIRRTMIKKIASILETGYLKKVFIQYI